MLLGVFLFVTISCLFCYLNFFFVSLPKQLPFSFFTSPSSQAGQLWLGILKQRMKKEPAPSLITPKFESLLEHQFFFAVNKRFVRKTHRKVIAPKALWWMHSEVVGFHCKGREIVHRNLSELMVTSLVKGKFPQVCYVVGKVLRSFTGRWFLGFTVYGTVFFSLQNLRAL